LHIFASLFRISPIIKDMSKYFNVIFLSSLAILLSAQGGSVKGTVLDKNHDLVIGASISLEGTIRTALTNDKGEYQIGNIQPGQYNLIVSYLGLNEAKQAVLVKPNETSILDITMTEQEYNFDIVHITATRTGGRHLNEVDGMSINATKKNEVVRLDKIDANLAMNNARQIFNKVPGISIWENDGSGIQLSIGSRGLSPNRSWEFNTRLNGYDITPDPMGYPEAYYTPPSEVVEKIEIVRGASSLQYGPQFGGLLNFVLRKPDISKKFTFESMNTMGSNGLFTTFNYVGGTIGRLSYTTYYQKRKGDGWRENSAFDSDHAHLQLSYAATEKLRLGAEVTYMDYTSQQAGGLTDSLFAVHPRSSSRSRNWFSAPWLVPALTADYIVNNNTKLNVKAFGTIGERNSIGFTKAINVKDDLGNRQIDRDLYKNIGAEARVLSDVMAFGKKHTIASGVRYFNGNTERKQVGQGDKGSDYNIDLLPGTDYNRDLDFKNINMSAFTEGIIRFNEKFLMTAGIRFEHISSTGQGRLGFTSGQPVALNKTTRERNFVLLGAGLEYHTTANQELYSNISQAYRPVLFSDLTPPATTDVIDENLQDANGYNFDLGYRGNVGRWLNFDVDYFYLAYNNRIGTIAQLGTDGKIYQFRTNLGQSISKGFEGYIEVKPLQLLNLTKAGNINLFASIANINANYGNFKVTSVSSGKINETNLNGNSVENAPENINRYGVTYGYKTFSITWQMSDISEAYADASNTKTANATATTGLIPGYTVQDLSATAKLFKNYILKAGVNNLSDNKYFTRRAGGYPGPGILPTDGRTMYVSVGIKF
jgi:Fe(3+) dicitrate transport protein